MHWSYTDELASRFPAIGVDPAVLYMDNGQVITSTGSAAGIDACLHLVERDFGAHITYCVARRLVMAPQHPGRQAQFIPALVPQVPWDDLSAVLEWARQHLDKPLTVSQLAAKALMMRPHLFASIQ